MLPTHSVSLIILWHQAKLNGTTNSLVLLSPYWYDDGQGPVHSSARLGRFLSLVDDAALEMKTREAVGSVNTITIGLFNLLNKQSKMNITNLHLLLELLHLTNLSPTRLHPVPKWEEAGKSPRRHEIRVPDATLFLIIQIKYQDKNGWSIQLVIKLKWHNMMIKNTSWSTVTSIKLAGSILDRSQAPVPK